MTVPQSTASESVKDDLLTIKTRTPLSFRIMNTAFMHFCKKFFTYYCPLTIIGGENIPIEPFIFCSNHTSHMDSAVLMTVSGLPFNQCAMVAAQDYFFEHGRKRNFVRTLMNLIPIDRHASKDSMLASIKLCEHFIKQGNQALIIYPEGTRSQTGEIQSFKKGPAWMAVRLQLPIIPVYLQGPYASMPKGRCFPRPQRLIANLGKAIYPQDYMWSDEEGQKRANAQSYRQITETLQTQVQLLREQTLGA